MPKLKTAGPAASYCSAQGGPTRDLNCRKEFYASAPTTFRSHDCIYHRPLRQRGSRQACEALNNLKLDHATIETAVWTEPRALKQPPGMPSTEPDVTVPRHCEVTGTARPTADSEIGFVLWLPPVESWNGKYMQRGNGGWAGSIQPIVLARP